LPIASNISSTLSGHADAACTRAPRPAAPDLAHSASASSALL
jgi:hypothetical protein